MRQLWGLSRSPIRTPHCSVLYLQRPQYAKLTYAVHSVGQAIEGVWLFFSLSEAALIPTPLLLSGNRDLTTYLRPVPGLRLRGAIPPVPRISSMRSAELSVRATSPLHFTIRDLHLRPTNFWDGGNNITWRWESPPLYLIDVILSVGYVSSFWQTARPCTTVYRHYETILTPQ